MQLDKKPNLQAIAMQLLYEKEQETMRLLDLALNQNQALLVQLQQQQALIAQQQQTINQLETELRTCISVQQSVFRRVHSN